jgi:transposase
MIGLVDKQKIIISHHREGKTQRQIKRETGINRKTIRKYIREYEEKKNILIANKDSDNAELIADIVEKPKYDTSRRYKVKLTDEIISRIGFHLKQNEEKRATGRSKQQKKKIDILEALADEGFDIGYTTVCNAITNIDRKQKEAYIRQEYSPGESAEFDWGELKLIIAGKLKIFQMSVFTTAKGDYRSGDLYYSQKTECFLDTHANFFCEVKGSYKEIVYDNTRVAVAKFVGRYEKEPTEALLKLSLYYGFKFRFCNNYRANEKGHVERSVEYIRRRIFSKRDEFASVEEARHFFRKELDKLNSRGQVLNNGKSAHEMLALEREYLLPEMPRYDTARTAEPRADKYSTIMVDSCHYSVPDSLVGQFIFTKVYPDRIICYHDSKEVARHKRYNGRHEWFIDISHYIKTLKLKPGALKRSVAFSQIKPELKCIYQKYYEGREKSFIELMELISEEGMDSIKDAVATLLRIDPNGIGTEKIKTIVQRNAIVPDDVKSIDFSATEASSKKLTCELDRILNGESIGSEVSLV